MKISFLSIGIEVAETVVDIFSSERGPEPPRSEISPARPFSPVLHALYTEISVILETPHGPEGLLADAPHRIPDGDSARQLRRASSPFLAETGRLGLKSILARSALLALPALAVLVVPSVARVALPGAGNKASLRDRVKGLLPARQPRLPPAS